MKNRVLIYPIGSFLVVLSAFHVVDFARGSRQSDLLTVRSMSPSFPLSHENSVLQYRLWSEYFSQAEELAFESRYVEAIALLNQIPETWHPSKVQQHLNEWSMAIVAVAENEYTRGNLEVAVHIAQAVPNDSPGYNLIQDVIPQWQTELNNLTTARRMLEDEYWQDSLDEACSIPTAVPYWETIVQPIIDEAEKNLRLTEVSTSDEFSSDTDSIPFYPPNAPHPAPIQARCQQAPMMPHDAPMMPPSPTSPPMMPSPLPSPPPSIVAPPPMD